MTDKPDKKAIDSLYKHHLELQAQVLQLSDYVLKSVTWTNALETRVRILERINEKLSAHILQISKN
jgi:hypothetical protein